MALGSNNPFPSALFVEQAAAPSGPLAPAAGRQRIFPSSTDHRWRTEDSAGGVRDLAGGLYTSDPPIDPAASFVYWLWEGGSPTSQLKLKAMRNGQIITVQSWTIEEDT